ncbi:MAG TPA: hypothetical protein VFF06_28265 [Polyangia bacterium]|nr:hypothetical protein [Polyangia bacterium]
MADFWYRFGYENVGVLYVGFVDWLRRRMAADGIDRAFFIARDGWIIHNVYSRMVAVESGPPGAYLYGSRRALNVPAITALDAKALDFLTSGSSRMTVAQFVGRLGLSVEEHRAAILDGGFQSVDQPLVPGSDFYLLRRLYQKLSEPILRVAAEEREAMIAHFRRLGLLDCARPGLVDLGWHGTLQRSVERMLALAGVEARPRGYYLGTFPRARELENGGQSMVAYLCENGEPERLWRIIRACVELFEFAFAAPHGSVVRMQRAAASQSASDEDVEPVFAPHDAEPEDRRKAERAQEGALAFVDDWLRGARAPVSPEAAVRPMERVLTRPTRTEARRLGDLRHAEGFGSVFVRRHIARPPSLAQVLENPRAIFEGFGTSFWREGYKTRLMGTNPTVRRLADLAARRLRIRGY